MTSADFCLMEVPVTFSFFHLRNNWVAFVDLSSGEFNLRFSLINDPFIPSNLCADIKTWCLFTPVSTLVKSSHCIIWYSSHFIIWISCLSVFRTITLDIVSADRVESIKYTSKNKNLCKLKTFIYLLKFTTNIKHTRM